MAASAGAAAALPIRYPGVARVGRDGPPDVRGPDRHCPICGKSLKSCSGGWCCPSCEAVWMFDGTAGTWVEPMREA
ncbi:MAG: hypothetical protein ACRDUA_13785, partial [Micromonosporaceae bacterium]